MSTSRTVILTCAALLAVTCIPFFWRRAEDSKLREELAGLQARRVGLEESIRVLGAARVEAAKANENTGEAQVRTVGEILKAAEEPIDAATLINSLMETMMTRDMVGMLRLFLPVANLGREEYDALMDEIQAYAGNPEMKNMALQMLAEFAPSGDHKESLERMIGLELQPHNYANKLGEWANEDPDAALAWFEAKRAAGELDGKGVNNTPEQQLLASLVGGIAKKDPERALDLYEAAADKDTRRRMTWQVGASLAALMKETGDDTYFRRMLDGDEDSRTQIVSSAVHSWAQDGKLDDGLAFIEKYLEKPDERRNALIDMLANQRDNLPLAERGDWLVAHTGEADRPYAVANFVQRMAWDRNAEMDKWLAAQPSGAARDRGFSALADARRNQRSYAESLSHVERIDDPALRVEAADKLAADWVAAEPEKARAALPAEALERLAVTAPK